MKVHTGAHRWAQVLLLLSLAAATSLLCCHAASSAGSSSASLAADKQLKKINDESHLTRHEQSSKHQTASAAAAGRSHNEASKVSEVGQLSSAQPVAEKKQGDTASAALLDASDEYVQIKPEEVSAGESGKDLLDSFASSSAAELGSPNSSAGQSSDGYKSSSSSSGATGPSSSSAASSAVDEELNAHLAHDSISEQESAYRPAYSMAGQPVASPRNAYAGGPLLPARPAVGSAHKLAPRPLAPGPHPSAGAGYYSAGPARGPRSPPRQPPSYVTLKGKLTGINSIISQYPHPAPGYPHQGPRHLPRGAAAGYAAFRDFVRAHASKYKHVAAQQQQAAVAAYGAGAQAAPEPAVGEYGVPAAPSGGPASVPGKGYASESAGGAYSPAPQQQAQQTSYGQPAAGGNQYGGRGSATKVTVAQAYIPHQAAAQSGGYEPGQAHAVAPYANPVLAKLYGAHAPQGVGKAEYSRDYGMVIHYPQATVYTEPMTVDQLHKLTGAGISQVIEQLQYNLAHGHRDESNTIRAHSKHHIGNGVTIHAKEYYAPSKNGQYVPTTAAILSTGAGSSASGKQYAGEAEPSSASYEPQGSGGYGGESRTPQKSSYALELGSGYERVKQAVAAGSDKYNNKLYGPAQAPAAPSSAPADYLAPAYKPPSAAGGQAANSYEQPSPPSADRYNSNGEPLSAITKFIGSELESLYKANSALKKQIEPEIQQAIAQMTQGGYGARPLRYTELGNKSPFRPGYFPLMPAAGPAPTPYGPAQGPRPAAQPQPQQPRGYPRGPRGPRRPAQPGYGAPRGGRGYAHRPQPRYPQPQPHPQPYGAPRPMAPNYQQQQALNQQVMQLLHDFQAGDEQYNGKSQSLHSINQGYPHKVLQKYSQQPQQQYGGRQQYGQQQQQYGQQQQASSYGYQQAQQPSVAGAVVSGYGQQHQEGLEIPQGPNDQIGEISELIESLKGALESNRPESGELSYPYGAGGKQQLGKQEDVRYLASALGQAPSYAMQVPVTGPNESGSAYGGADGKKSPGDAYAQQPAAPQAAYGSAASSEQQTGGYLRQQQQQAAPAELYGQQQPQQQQQQQQQAQDGGYAPQQQAGGYAQLAQQQQSSYAPQQQQQQAAGYGLQVVENAYGQQQPQQAQEYQQQPSGQQYQASAVATPGGYGSPASSAGSPVAQTSAVAGSYPSSAAEHPQQQQQQAGYGISEHTQVINHLVPAVSQQQPAAYEQHQPAADQALAIQAPTEAHYQQAQSLSSFVDSLSSDYQEILRQPALLDAANAANSAHSHLAIQAAVSQAAQDAAAQSGQQYGASNATSAAAGSSLSAYESAPVASQVQPAQARSSSSSSSSAQPVSTSKASRPATSGNSSSSS